MAKFKLVEWLILWLQETSGFQFDWDDGNRTKNAMKHAVTTAEAEEVFLSGQAASLFTLRTGKIRPISARPADK